MREVGSRRLRKRRVKWKGVRGKEGRGVGGGVRGQRGGGRGKSQVEGRVKELHVCKGKMLPPAA
jgi:hypothetical protein